ncbi:succinate dehydrogenase assembly factor 2 [Rhodocyclus tenuis]|uniref:FAD assembly factor SdhE n=1 Tax=Rhodocyclus tenuis TaxID=1066 RepID=A0A840G6I1_RHOTE|nr:succinate dehydrogenase assembly factor 2 [Rhodocyclus tenuis]MBB4247011.1 succinate dehydrogenase flavin-adding protein (antitoxin of CptAB toxin-antitoxin module) [Rhodocyclus tenuis]
MHHDDLNRLRWRCTRRAFLELDLLLGEFLDQRFNGLTEEQARAFAVLADLDDHELWPLVNGSQTCDDPQQAAVLAMLRESRENPA